ncbi:MAG: alkaline phosphatase family protein [Anaerolineae bacterium]|nr:alkaline phosphatase family protein [Anaerolineae bacterium]
MTESLAVELEQAILEHQIMPITCDWADEIIFPYYNGLSIRNLAHTVVRLLDSKPSTDRLGSAPLDSRLWEHLWGQVRRVVLFLSDGLGWQLLQEIMAEDAATAQVIADLVGDGTLTPITSIAPSTTAAALPCIWTGASPAATGAVGTVMFMREFNTLSHFLHFTPVSGRHRPEVLEEWGLDFDNFLPVDTLGEALSARRIPSYLLLEKSLLGSGLSRLMHRGIQHAVRHVGYTDMWIGLRDLLRKTRRNRCFISVYWGAVDGVSHLYGTTSEASITEIRCQLTDLRDVLAQDKIGDGRTLLMFAADHGHTPVEESIHIADHPPLAEALRCGRGGEERFGYYYLRTGYRQSFIDYLQAHFSDKLLPLIPSEALDAGLFGPETPDGETALRLGDLTVIARQGVSFTDREKTGHGSPSRHGGLSAREMLVPLLMRVL